MFFAQPSLCLSPLAEGDLPWVSVWGPVWALSWVVPVNPTHGTGNQDGRYCET